MAKPRAGFSARPLAAAWAASDPNLPTPTPTSTTRADLSSTGAASASRSSVGSSSSTSTTDLAFMVMEICKHLSYDEKDADGSVFPAAAASGMKQQMELVPEGLAPLLDLPDPGDASSTTFLSDATNASAYSTVTQVTRLADSNTAAAGAEGPVLTDMELVLAELHHARGLTDKRLLAAPAEAASAELSNNTASTGAASANSSSVVSSSSTSTTDLAFIVMEICKHLSYDDKDGDGSAFPAAAASGMEQQMELVPEGLADPAPLLDLPDPDDASSTTFFSASAGSTVTQVAAPADSNTAGAGAGAEGPVLTDMELVLAELHGARGLTPRSRRLLAALAEAASAELSNNPTAAALPMRRGDFWRKVRVGILAATVFSVAAMDIALAVALFGGRRGNALYSNVLPPT